MLHDSRVEVLARLLVRQMVLLRVVQQWLTAAARLLIVFVVIIILCMLWLWLLGCSLAHVVIGVALAAGSLVLGLASGGCLASDGGLVDEDHFSQLRSDLKSLELLV